MSRIVKHRYWDGLNDSDKARYGRIADRYIAFTALASMCVTIYLVTHVWHWPFWLAYTAGPLLGALLGFAAITAPLWIILSLAVIYRKRTRPATDSEKA